MGSQTPLSKDDRNQNFKQVDAQLREMFSKYPFPRQMEACPHCEQHCDDLERGVFKTYLFKAMTTWGSEEDFKHFIPALLSYVFLKSKGEGADTLVSKLNYVKEWEQDEALAIESWIFAFEQCKCLDDFEEKVQSSRNQAQNWFEDRSLELNCEFPFSVFFTDEFKEIKSILHPTHLAAFADVLDLWPQYQLDFIALAASLSYEVIAEMKEAFDSKRVSAWIAKNKKAIEEQFWETSNEDLQKMFSTALELIDL